MKQEIQLADITGFFENRIAEAGNSSEIDCSVYNLEMKDNYMDGIAEMCHFEKNHMLFTLNAQVHLPVELTFGTKTLQSPLLCLLFNNGDEIRLNQSGFNYTYTIAPNSFCYAQLWPEDLLKIRLSGNSLAKAILFVMSTDIIIHKYKCSVEKLPKSLQFDEKSKNSPSRKDFSLSLRESTSKVFVQQIDGLQKRITYEGICYELFSHAIGHIKDVSQEKGLKIQSHEVEKILKVSQILEERYFDPPSQFEFTKMIGLNKNKLTKGFASQFGCTINQYLNKVRMKKAKSLLINQKLNVNEASEKVGISNPSYFAKKFREFHGYLPSEVK